MLQSLPSHSRPISPVQANSASRVVICASPTGFAAIHEPRVDLVLWQRRLPDALVEGLATLDTRQMPDGRFHVRLRDLRCGLEALCDASSTPHGPTRSLLIDDIVTLARHFADTMSIDTVDLRLEAITSDACWRFHRDCVSARLLTTYVGPATQWVGAECAERALAEQQSFAGPIEQFPPHAVGIFKGSCDGRGRGLVHRSPPIAGTGHSRLLLCLNLPSAASPDLLAGESLASGLSCFRAER